MATDHTVPTTLHGLDSLRDNTGENNTAVGAFALKANLSGS